MNNNINNKKIYSIQNTKDGTRLIEIETIILNGLYKFSILGTNQKNINDTKDRIYSALRSQKIINLKSNNKKITVNILPRSTDTLDNTYDLAIAIGLIKSMSDFMLQENIIAIGELSILGKIISTKNILKVLYNAKKNNIKMIICSTEDIDTISRSNINTCGIKFVTGIDLEDLIINLRNKNYHIFDENINKKHINNAVNTYHELNKNIYKCILALCTNRHILIEYVENSDMVNFIKNLIFYQTSLEEDDILYLANRINITDREIIDEYSIPHINIIDSQNTENEIDTGLERSCFGFNVISNIMEIDKNILNIVKKKNLSSVLSFYKTCPCGNNNNFFKEDNYELRCFCLQRNIVKYKQKIRLADNGFFDFHIINTSEKTSDYTQGDYVNINKNISIYRKSDLKIDIKDEVWVSEYIYSKLKKVSAEELNKVINLSKDIQKYHALFINKNMIDLEKTSIDLAIDFFKKGF